MSGAEIGLALAIIPLCIAAAENYNNVLRPFKHYHNYAIEVQRFEDELANQQVIYVLELQLLLSSVTSWETTEAMVEDPHHPKWKDADIEERLSAWLGKSYESCGKAIRLICEDLASIAKESSFFDTDTEETALPMPPTDKSWKDHKDRIGRKLKWSLSKSELHKRLEDLIRHVELFRRHRSQASKVLKERQKARTDRLPTSSKTESTAETHVVHKAASELCHALVSACKLHQEHKIHFRLDTRRRNTEQGSFIRFTLGYIPNDASSRRNPMWILIESEFGMTAMLSKNARLSNDTSVVPIGQGLLKRVHQSPLFEVQRKKKRPANQRSVHFESSGPALAMVSATQPRQPRSCLSSTMAAPASERWSPPGWVAIELSETTASSKTSLAGNQSTQRESVNVSLSTSLPDFCEQQDLCIHIASHSKTVCHNEEGCIGYLGKESSKSRRILLPASNSQDQCNPRTLADLISDSQGQARSRRFSQLDSIRLAKKLAVAILTYYSTPMLEETWDSKDVILYEGPKSTLRRPVDLSNPHLSVHMIDNQSPSISQDLEQRRRTPRDKQVRNVYTYRLGVILLELAFQVPLSKLLEEELEVDDQATEFDTVNRISESVSTEMGICFQKIVQECLNCDFGYGCDLNDANLQAAFHKNVVCGLEGIEDSFGAMQLGSS